MPKFEKYSDEHQAGPDYSLTFLDGEFELFHEFLGKSLGLHSYSKMLQFGFTKDQLRLVEQNGAVDFVRV
jgi:hypothetical protein